MLFVVCELYNVVEVVFFNIVIDVIFEDVMEERVLL